MEHSDLDGVRMRLPFSDAQIRPGGTLSGPTMMALADGAAWMVTLARIGPVALAVTSNLTISFLAKPAPVDLLARAWPNHARSTLTRNVRSPEPSRQARRPSRPATRSPTRPSVSEGSPVGLRTIRQSTGSNVLTAVSQAASMSARLDSWYWQPISQVCPSTRTKLSRP